MRVSLVASHTLSPLLVSVITPQPQTKFKGSWQQSQSPNELSLENYKSQNIKQVEKLIMISFNCLQNNAKYVTRGQLNTVSFSEKAACA